MHGQKKSSWSMDSEVQESLMCGQNDLTPQSRGHNDPVTEGPTVPFHEEAASQNQGVNTTHTLSRPSHLATQRKEGCVLHLEAAPFRDGQTKH
ncbi:unnamed protein product [Lampetra planeri]